MTSPAHSSGSSPAIVLGTGLTVLGVLRCLARTGIPAVCVSEAPDFEAASRWYVPASRRVPAWASADDLLAALASSSISSGVLIPCSDHWAVEAARLAARQDHPFRSSCADAGVVSLLIDKDGFRSHLERAGVPHPFTRPVSDETELVSLMESAPDGVFLKPTDSQRFVATFHRKAFPVATVDEAVERFREARAAGIDLVLQEYVAGGADRHIFVDGFVGRDHRLHATFARRRLRMHPADFGNSSAVVSIDTSEVPDAIDSLGRLFRSARYRGIFSAEFLDDGRDGRMKLLEVNCRPWWYVEFAARCGVNVVEMAYRDALGEPPPTPRSIRVGVELVYGYYDYHACRRLVAEGRMRRGACVRSWARSEKAIFAADDPRPAIVNFLRRLRGRFGRSGSSHPVL